MELVKEWEDPDLLHALLEAVWIMRWSDNGESMTAVLSSEEAMKVCGDIVQELDKAGYKIVKK